MDVGIIPLIEKSLNCFFASIVREQTHKHILKLFNYRLGTALIAHKIHDLLDKWLCS